MNFRPMPPRVAAGLWLIASLAGVVHAQESPVQRIANIVTVAVSEYAKGGDARGRLTAPDEDQETLGFLSDPRRAAARLTSTNGGTVRLLARLAAAWTRT